MTGIVAPTKLIKVRVATATVAATWTTVDQYGFTGSPYRWTVQLLVTPQPHSYALSNTPYSYDGSDIAVGDWLSNETGGMAWQVISISAHTSSSVTCIVEDINRYNTLAAPGQNGDGSPPALIDGFIFSTGSDGMPILSPTIENVLTSQWQADLQGRFLLTKAPVVTGSTYTLPPASNTLGGVNKLDPQAHLFVTGTDASGNFLTATPLPTDITGLTAYVNNLINLYVSHTAVYTIAHIDAQTNGVAFTVSGTIAGIIYPPILYYSADSTNWYALPVGSFVNGLTYSFVHPGMTTAASNYIYIRDFAGAAVAQSNQFAVTVPVGNTIAISASPTIPIVSGQSTASLPVSATLFNYSTVPTLTYSLGGINGTFVALPGGAVVTTTSVSFTIPNVTGGTFSLVIKDSTNSVASAIATVKVAAATLSAVPVVATVGTAITGATSTLLGLTIGYAVLSTGGVDEGSRVSFSGTTVPSLTPQLVGTYTLRVYDAVANGNLLAESSNIAVSAVVVGPGFFALEDGSGALLLEDASGYLTLEA